MFIKTKYILTGALALGVLSGCNIPKNIPLQEAAKLPAAYPQHGSDTITVAQLKIEDFFTDAHLQELIRKVWAHNLDHQIAARQLDIAHAYLKARKGALLPAVQAGIKASGTRYGKYTMEGVGNFDTNLSPNIEDGQRINTTISPDYWLGLNATWEVDLWGKLAQMKQAAQQRVLSSEQGMALLRSALTTQTAALYYELVTLDIEVEILQENITLQQKALEVVEVQKEVGRATELAVQQFKAQLLNTQATLFEAKQQILAAENQLNLLQGRYEGEISRSHSFDVKGLAHLVKLGNPNQLLTYRPDIMADYHELQATQADAKAIRAAFFPTLQVSAYMGLSSFNPEKVFNPASLVAQMLGGLTAPVFAQHQLRTGFKVAKAQQEIAFMRYQQTVNRAFQEVKTLVSEMENNRQVLDLKKLETEALSRSVDIANEMYVAAYANYLEIIAAQKSKLAADLDRLRARRNQMQIMIQLYKALGGGWS